MDQLFVDGGRANNSLVMTRYEPLKGPIRQDRAQPRGGEGG